MKKFPFWIRFQFTKQAKQFKLWIPIFLLWILLLPIILIGLLIAVILDLFYAGFFRWTRLLLGIGCLLCEIHGTTIMFRDPKDCTEITIMI